MAQSFEAWWASLGPVTKFVLIGCFLSTGAFSFGFMPLPWLIINWNDFFWKLHLWRPVTATLFLGKFGFPWLIGVAMLVMWVKRHEDEDFVGRTADMVFMVSFLSAVLHLLAFCFGMMLVSFAFSTALLWVWCRRHEDAQLSLYSFSFRAAIFPWVICGFHLIMGQSVFDDLMGIVAGHAYYFLMDILPKTHNMTLLWTPQFLYNIWPNQRMGAATVHGAAAARGPVPGQAQQAHRWGGGRALGGGA